MLIWLLVKAPSKVVEVIPASAVVERLLIAEVVNAAMPALPRLFKLVELKPAIAEEVRPAASVEPKVPKALVLKAANWLELNLLIWLLVKALR